jgi:putative membrane protein
MKMKKQIWMVAAIAAGVSLSSTLLRADDKDQTRDSSRSGKQTSATQGKQTSDTKFLEEASKGGQAEVKMGELAQQKAQSESVKQFGQRLVKDHTEANQKLERICDQKGVSKSTDIGNDKQQMLDHLTGLSGEDFDKAFIQHAVTDHRKDVKKFEKQASEGEDPAIRSFASETLPTLREHLKIAEALKENPNASVPELKESAGAERKSQSQQDQQKDQSQQQDQQKSQDQQQQQSDQQSKP